MLKSIRFVPLVPIAAIVTMGTSIFAEDTPSQLSGLLSGGGDAGFEKAIGPREFSFPTDHGPHPEFRNEWWYVTGNLDGDNERRFGFELTFFRFALAPGVPEHDSNWRTNQIYIAHFALTDAGREQFYVAERYSRGALGLAGAAAEPFHVWIDDWEIGAADNGRWRLRASDAEFAIDIELSAAKPPVLNGKDGLSQKSAATGNASYYYSITRLISEGKVRIGDDDYRVSGLSWLDREWSSSALASDQQGWDWFALQLSDGSELMFYNIRNSDGRQDRHSAGTWVSDNGSASYIGHDEIGISSNDSWTNPAGDRYPSGWTIQVPRYDLSLNVTPVMDDQELSTLVRYWEGAVDVAGAREGASLTGRGYVELTGYADP